MDNNLDNKMDDVFSPDNEFVKSSVIKLILDELFNSPQKNMNFVHVAGTNGKGSTSTMISSVLTAAGYKTGLFTSPSVKSFMERIKINGNPMPFNEYKTFREKILNDGMKIVKSKFPKKNGLGEFSIITMAAFNYFKENNCQVSVLEAGIGGYKDATNIIDSPLVSVITSISFDHMGVLGNTIEEIAFQKSGIIKPGRSVVVSAGQDQRIYNVIKETAKRNSSKLIIPDPKDIQVISSDVKNGTIFKYKGLNIKINLLGKHQIENALTALTAIDVLRKELDIPDNAIINGMESAFINARLEILSKTPLIILDGAHNEAGIKSLAEFAKEYLKGKDLIGIIGMCKDKNSTEAFKEILPLFSQILTVEIPRFPRTMPLQKLTSIVKQFNNNVQSFSDIEHAISYAKNKCSDNSAIIIFGSLYLARRIIRNPNIKFGN